MSEKSTFDILNIDRRLARARLTAPLVNAEIGLRAVGSGEHATGAAPNSALVSQLRVGSPSGDNFDFQTAGELAPRPEDYLAVRFRALSKTIVPGHWIDYSRGDVLKNSVPLLFGATVYPNHAFGDVTRWLGSVSESVWDEEGAAAGGVAGINVEYKIDAVMNPRVARGLLIRPPAIHSTSMTVMFTFEPSHNELFIEDRHRYFDLLGEEVDGEIVRFIATEILDYWEASLVFRGADRLAKQYDEPTVSQNSHAPERRAAPFFENAANSASPSNLNEEKTMKLTSEQKTKLGIEFDGDEVPETELLRTADSLASRLSAFNGVDPAQIDDLRRRADAGDAFVARFRSEVKRLAELAELGGDAGELDEVVTQQIEAADYGTLVKLESYFSKKSAARFPQNGRSSFETSDEIDAAGGVNTQTRQHTTVPSVNLL